MSRKTCYEELEKRVHELEKVELELKKTESLLQDEVNWRRLLIEESRDAIVVLDQNAKVHEANNRFADMLGYSSEELSQLYVWDWDVHFSKDQILEMVRQVDAVGFHHVIQQRRKDGRVIDVEISSNGAIYQGKKLIFCICRDISGRKKVETERERLIKRLQESLAEIKALRGILPICCYCKKVRDDKGYWEQVDIYINKHSEADISHSICPECIKDHFPNEYSEIYPDSATTD